MKKTVSSIMALILAGILFGGFFYYLKTLDKNYDSLMSRAQKIQKDHHEFIDFFGEREPVIPSKEENSKTLLGIDINDNGIRDDLDVWINRTALTKNENLAMRQYARAKQGWLKACDQKAISDVAIIQNKMDKALICLRALSDYKRREDGYALDKLELLLMNTKPRMDCKAFYPSHTLIPGFSLKDKFECDFEVQSPENVVSGNEEWEKSKRL